MRWAPSLVALALAGCGAQLGEPPSPVSAMPGKGDGPGPAPGPGSSGGGGGSGSATPITATRYLDGLASLDCNEAFMCQSSFPTDLGYEFSDVYSTSVQACNDLLITDWKPATTEDEIAQNRLGFDGVAAAECLPMITFGDCVDFFHSGPHWAAPCYQMFTPKVMKGGACALDASCTTGTCDPTTGTCS